MFTVLGLKAETCAKLLSMEREAMCRVSDEPPEAVKLPEGMLSLKCCRWSAAASTAARPDSSIPGVTDAYTKRRVVPAMPSDEQAWTMQQRMAAIGIDQLLDAVPDKMPHRRDGDT